MYPAVPTFEINGHGASVYCQFDDMHKRKPQKNYPIGKVFGFADSRITQFWVFLCNSWAKIDAPVCPDL